MRGKPIQLLVLGGLLAAVAWAYVKGENELERIAEESGLDAEQTAAFRACDRDMSGKSLSLGDTTYSQVPEEICVCHSPEMVTVFRSGEYSSHRNVVEYLTEENVRKPLNQSQLKRPASAEGDFDRLADSLRRCAVYFRLERDRRAREALERVCKELETRRVASRPSQCADLASGRP